MTLARAELYDTADSFGVDLEQVERDHVISHVLASIAERTRDAFLFTGGTMLSRTWLPDVRLSEDVDLMVPGSRTEAGRLLGDALGQDLPPQFGPIEWSKHPADAKDTEPVFLSAGETVTIKFQLVDCDGRPHVPRELVDIHQRYSDAPRARLWVPTREAAVAMKLTAWVDRRVPRDLYDLWAMSQRDMVTADAWAAYGRHGQTTRQLPAHVFRNPPSEKEWRDALGHQCRLGVTAREAINAVGRALDQIGAIAGDLADDDESTAWMSAPQTPQH